MNEQLLTGKLLKARGWPEGKVIGLAKAAGENLQRTGVSRDEVLNRLDAVRENPRDFLEHTTFGAVALETLRREVVEQARYDDKLRDAPLEFPIWGREGIDIGAIAQMETSMALPITAAGALMPDAHIGYGLPIGGVLATKDAVIPYAVGVDIACFTGDTRVVTADGETHAMRDLAERAESFVVFSITPTQRIVAAHATCQKTRENAELLEVELDNGEIVRCTPDHQWMQRDGSYCQAKDLQAGSSLMPFYAQRDKEGYTRIQQPYSGYWQRAHWMVARSGLLGEVPKFDGQRTVIHHLNFQEADNRPENLEFMGDGDHARLHRALVERNTHFQSPEFEARRVAALGAKARTPAGHDYFAQRGSANLRNYWANDYERAKANCAGNGARGKAFLIAKNQSEAGRAKSRELAKRIYTCETCGAQVRSPIGLHNHRRHVHHYNHKVVRVTTLTEREDVYCLSVPEWENFALAAGVFVHNCRMKISIFEASPHVIGQHGSKLERALRDNTGFGMAVKWTGDDKRQHDVLDDPAWQELPLLKGLHRKAIDQLGTSGSGNHFVEWGEFELSEDSLDLALPKGKYLALLSHSGSRGIGHKIATYYSKLATQMHPMLPPSAKNLAWLPLESAEGQEYWLAMELAGRFASACHSEIHRTVARAAGFKPIASVENHHNFAWRETLEDGTPVIVHRKGATPAGEGVLGIIPGSMADPGYVVRGRGLSSSLNSASHGAGRAMGRKQAINSLTHLQRDRYLQERNVKLMGGGLDEAPQAYKNIDEVLAAQTDLVDVLGKFSPRIVRMADEPGDI